MKATGIIRRIDDLGRVVIPKEVRRIMRVREGEPLEIFLMDDGVFLKKYDSTKSITGILQELKDVVYDSDELEFRGMMLERINEIAAAVKAEQNERKD